MKIATKSAIALLWVSSSAFAGTSGLLDAAHIGELMKKEQPCCVIDARDEGLRKQQPIPFAITYNNPDIKTQADGYALVVGNSDGQAQDIAKKIADRNAGAVYAAQGGYNAWKQTQVGDASDVAVVPSIFTIPKNTCEQGKAVQEFKK